MKKILFIALILIMINHPVNSKDLGNLSYKNLELSNKPYYKDFITSTEFDEDLDLLRFALKKAYGAKGLISNCIFTKVDNDLKNLKFINNPAIFCLALGKILSQFPDSHLKVKYNNKSCYNHSFNFVNIGKNKNDSNKPWKGIKDKYNVYTIAISNFTAGNWPGFMKFIEEAKKNARYIIIDLRGNAGGDDAMGYKLAAQLAEQDIHIPQQNNKTRNTIEAITIWNNYLKLQKISSNDAHTVEAIENYICKNNSEIEQLLSSKLKISTNKRSTPSKSKYNPNKGFQGPIYILQDKKCASSCESTIDFFEYFPNLKKIGSNTAGMVHFGNIGLIILPNSGIHILMPTKYTTYKDGRFIEFKGIQPDVVLEGGQDAYQFVMEIIKKSF